jgi:CHAT domain-containing protein/tetratricopeptide (TPR) repeat protein
MEKSFIHILFLLFLINTSFAEAEPHDIHFENGYVHHVRGEYGKALEAFQQFIAEEQKATNPRRLKMAMMHRYRGNCFEQLHLSDEAIAEFFLALELYEELNDSAGISVCLEKSGNLFYKENKLEQATLFLNEAKKYFEKMRWVARLQISEFELGKIEYQAGNYFNARQHFEQALTLKEKYKLSSENMYIEGETWFFLAKIAALHDSVLIAKDLLQQAEKELQMYVTELPQFYSQLINVLIFKSELLFESDRVQAWAAISQADQISKENGQTQNTFGIDLAKADFYCKTGNFEKAGDIYLTLQKKIKGKPGIDAAFPGYSQFLLAFYDYYLFRFEAEPNIANLEKALGLLELYSQAGQYKEVYALLRDRSFSGENSKMISDRIIAVCFQLFELTGIRAYFEKAFTCAEEFSKSLFVEKMEMANAGLQSPEAEKMKVEEAELKLKINHLLAQSDNEKAQTPEIQKQLTGLIHQLEKRNITKTPSEKKKYYPSPEDLVAELQQKLVDASYLKFYETKTEIFRFLVTPDEIEFQKIPKTEELQNALTFYSGFISNPGTGIDLPEIEKYTEAAFSLYNQLIFPLGLKPFKGDIIADWQGNNPFVFEALLTSPVENSSINMKELPFFIFERNILYSGSVSSFISGDSRSLSQKPLNYSGLAPFAEKGTGNREKLQSSGAEVKKLAKIFEGNRFVSARATKSTLQEIASETQILHLATHAQNHAVHPQLAELNFYGENGHPEKLYFYEILNSDWENRLILLGACGTSNGEYIPNYGTVSLSNAFKAAGAGSVIGANWQSNDFASLKIFSEMAELIKAGEETGESLRQSKIKFLNQANDLFSHPYYWAVYTYHGTHQHLIFTPEKSKFLVPFIIILPVILLAFYFFKKFLRR